MPFTFHIEEGPELRWATEQLLARLGDALVTGAPGPRSDRNRRSV